MGDKTKTYTIQSTCKRCGATFTYIRKDRLIGRPRTTCQRCRGGIVEGQVVAVQEE